MKKKSKAKKWIILGIVAAVVIAVVVLIVVLRANIEKLSKTMYDIVDVQNGVIEVKVKGAGAVEPLVDETVYASFNGKVSEVYSENGDVVSADDVIAVFESDSLDAEKEALEQQIEDTDTTIATLRRVTGSDKVYSPAAGTVKVLFAGEGDNVDVVMDEFGALAVICPDELMQVTLAAVDGLNPGDAVMLTLETGSVDGLVYAIDRGTGEMTVQFSDDGYLPGERVDAALPDGTALGQGTAEVANPVYIVARGGVIDRVYEDVGDDVRRGGKLFLLDGEILSAELYAQIETRRDLEDDLAEVNEKIGKLTVRAGTDGVVSALGLNAEQVVQEGTPLFTVQSNKQIKVDVEIDELDIANITQGQTAEVTFDALPGKTYQATVHRINPVGVSVNNVTNFTITLQIEQDGQILLGMSADVEIVSQSASDVLVIPIEAIQIIDGEKFVVLEQDIDEELSSTPATHKIETGITDGVLIEVTAGLAAGDRVAVPQARELTIQELQQRMISNNRDDSEE